jgi:hypothetical protein
VPQCYRLTQNKGVFQHCNTATPGQPYSTYAIAILQYTGHYEVKARLNLFKLKNLNVGTFLNNGII